MAEAAERAVEDEELPFAMKINEMSPAPQLLSIIPTLTRPIRPNRLITAPFQAATVEVGTAAVLDAAPMANEGVASDS
jgi:hypothetical protein